jgi:adenosylcobinamide-GDP ribazoletransferase
MLATARFLTRLPLPGNAASDLHHIHAVWFPFVGLAIGAVMAASDITLSSLEWPIRNALVIGIGVLVTGALHLDALMDTVDGLAVPGAESQKAMRSSVHTAEGAAAGILVLCLAWLALDQLTDSTRSRWLICAPLLGRTAIVLGYRLFRSNVDAGPVTLSLAKSARGWPATGAVVLALLACIALTTGDAIPTLGTPVVVTIVAALAFRWRTGALRGDHYGALAVIGEVSLLLCAAFVQPELQ